MRPLATLKFIADRVVAHVRANPPPPGVALLGESAPRVAVEMCARGHNDWTTQHGGKRRCRPCLRAWQRERRERVKG